MGLLSVAQGTVGLAQKGRNSLDNLANKYIVKPKGTKGIEGFVFDYAGETEVQLSSDITDHYAEDNTVIHDHIVVKPVRLTLKGFVGELLLKKPAGLVGALDLLQNKLTTVPAYLRQYTPGVISKIQEVTTKAQNVVSTVDQALARTKNVLNMFKKSTPAQTKQQVAYFQLKDLWTSRWLCMVETPYETYYPMVIESLIFFQDEQTNDWTDIGVTMKQIRLVDVDTVPIDPKVNRSLLARAAQANNGKTAGSEQDNESILYKVKTQAGL